MYILLKKEGPMATTKLWLSWNAWKHLKAYVAEADGEISGLGRVVLRNKKLLVTEVYLLPQTASLSETDLTQEGLVAFLSEVDKPEEIKLWWHSHADMDVFWSATDEGTIAELSKTWFTSLVANKKGLMLARMDIFEPIQISVDMKVTIAEPMLTTAFKQKIRAEIDEKVETTKYPSIISWDDWHSKGGSWLDHVYGDKKTSSLPRRSKGRKSV